MITPDELANGWTEESLKKYQAEREKAALNTVSADKIVRPQSQERFRPLRWRE